MVYLSVESIPTIKKILKPTVDPKLGVCTARYSARCLVAVAALKGLKESASWARRVRDVRTLKFLRLKRSFQKNK